jgi:hypothetical protein
MSRYNKEVPASETVGKTKFTSYDSYQHSLITIPDGRTTHVRSLISN